MPVDKIGCFRVIGIINPDSNPDRYWDSYRGNVIL